MFRRSALSSVFFYFRNTTAKHATHAFQKKPQNLQGALKLVLDKQKHKRHVSRNEYLKLLNGFSRAHDMDNALRVLLMMMDSTTTPPDIECFNIVMHGFSVIKQVDKAVELMEQLKSNGIEPNVQTYNIIIKGYTVLEQPEKAEEILSRGKEIFQQPIEASIYSSLMVSYVRTGKLREAERVYQQMLEQQIEPDVVAYNTLLNAYAKEGRDDKMKQVLDLLQKENKIKDAVTYSILLQYQIKNNQFGQAIQMFNQMKQEKVPLDVYIFSIMINGYLDQGQVEEAEKLLTEMEELGIAPTLVSITGEHGAFETLLKLSTRGTVLASRY
jgi:leucine-rich PPR motif-containing protein